MQLPFRFVQSPFACLILLAIFSPGCAHSQTFSSTGSLDLALVYQTATLLQDGTVLIAGGASTAGRTNTAEIYNPSTGTFTPTVGEMNAVRSAPTATLLQNGLVLIAGGDNSSGNAQSSAELYNPATGTFSITGSMTTALDYATATLLNDGTVLIAGGVYQVGTASAEIYNPATGTFTATKGNMTTKRVSHTATLLADGSVLIAGGLQNNSGETVVSTAERYIPSTGQFAAVGSMTTARFGHSATLLNDGTVLIAGGAGQSGAPLSSAEVYSPSAASFSAVGAMHTARTFHTATALYDGTVLVAGGQVGDVGGNVVSGPYTSSAEVYTPSLKTFAVTGNLITARGLQTATLLGVGTVLEAGGGYGSASSVTSSAELYSYPFKQSVIYPAYHVTSIIYAPPGNKSQDGYTDTTTNATTTTIGSNFTEGSSITFSEGFNLCDEPCKGSLSLGESFGTSSTTTNSTAFLESYSSATSVANASISTNPDAINHNLDEFLVWLNPQVTVTGSEANPVIYSTGVQPLANGTIPQPDIVPVTANVMEANSAGVSTVPAGLLNQQNTSSGYLPGLASICKNLIQAEYAARTCTFPDQCGCTPADFAPILATDPLLFYNGATNPISPFPGTISPLEANTSSGTASDANCGTLPTPNLTGSDCRYVPVPSSLGGSVQENPPLVGPGDEPDGFQLGENQQTTQTLGGQTQLTVGSSLKVGTPAFSMTEQNTWTWTEIQNVGTANASGYVQTVTLNSGTTGCSEYVPIFEDTLYHTFVFQELPNPGSTCTQNPPNFTISVTPNSTTQTALSLGHSMSFTVSVSAWYGLSSTVALSVGGLPAGVTASLSPASVTTSTIGNATLTLTAAYSTSTFIGSSTVTVTGTSAGVAKSTPFTLTTRPLQYRGYCGVQ
jgi:hypothetical protein